MPTECPCLGTGYENPWVAPLLAECLGCDNLRCPGNMLESIAGVDLCQGTGKRYPQLWRRCPCIDGYNRKCLCNGSGWIPNITTAGLWDVAGDIGMSAVVDKLPYDMLYDWIMLLTEEQRMEALANAISQ